MGHGDHRFMHLLHARRKKTGRADGHPVRDFRAQPVSRFAPPDARAIQNDYTSDITASEIPSLRALSWNSEDAVAAEKPLDAIRRN
jgi:hypothetical protein